ncbi:DUF2911 domain-containing protein [bacterium]|nr:DUF2911 domain-containing protein [bacterium]
MKNQLVLLIFGLLLTGCSTESGWNPDEPRAFVTTLGADTVSVEVYLRTESSIEGVLVERSPYTHVIDYAAQLDGDGMISELTYTKRTPESNPTGPAAEGAHLMLSDGMATIVRESAAATDTISVAASAGTIPTLGRNASSMFIFEYVAARLHAGNSDVLLLSANGSEARPNASAVVSSDTVSMDYFGAPRKGWTDSKGQLLGVSGAGTTNKSESKRVEPFLVGQMAERWAAMDVAGTGIGTPSPGATVAISLDGTHIEVKYSQPAKRGREIWGQLVPEGQVWRTGANAATHFATSESLTFDGQVLPAGTYTLWSVYSNGGLTLVINAQTNQWGTVYDQGQDVFRSAMIHSSRAESSERFEITIEDTAEGGVMHFDWDMDRFSIPFTVN